jgi:hypothetical protein
VTPPQRPAALRLSARVWRGVFSLDFAVEWLKRSLWEESVVDRQPQGEGGLLEERQRRQSLRVDVPRREDRHHLRGQPFELRGVPPLGIDRREVEQDHRGIEADPALDKELSRLLQRGPRSMILTSILK